MNEMQFFDAENNEIRVIMRGGEPWWALKDVCGALGLGNPARTANRLDEDDLMLLEVMSGGQKRDMLFVNEYGLYEVIVRSDKPNAKAFCRWVTHEVLPTIRKTGKYEIQPRIETNSKPDGVQCAFIGSYDIHYVWRLGVRWWQLRDVMSALCLGTNTSAIVQNLAWYNEINKFQIPGKRNTWFITTEGIKSIICLTQPFKGKIFWKCFSDFLVNEAFAEQNIDFPSLMSNKYTNKCIEEDNE